MRFIKVLDFLLELCLGIFSLFGCMSESMNAFSLCVDGSKSTVKPAHTDIDCKQNKRGQSFPDFAQKKIIQ